MLGLSDGGVDRVWPDLAGNDQDRALDEALLVGGHFFRVSGRLAPGVNAIEFCPLESTQIMAMPAVSRVGAARTPC